MKNFLARSSPLPEWKLAFRLEINDPDWTNLGKGLSLRENLMNYQKRFYNKSNISLYFLFILDQYVDGNEKSRGSLGAG